MHLLFWIVGSIYVVGFAFVLFMEVTMGPVTFPLALVRALVWPLYVFFGIPGGQRLPMD